MRNKFPLVSSVIPVYNGEKFLADAINSVLVQSYPNIECIVVNDGSRDGTADIARSFGDRIRYYDKPNGGVSSARNFGVERAEGDYIAFLDADDIWLPNKIEKQIQLITDSPEIGLVFSAIKLVDENKEVIGQTVAVDKDELVKNVLLLKPNTGGISTTGMVRRSVFAEIGGFDENLSTSADADFLCRLYLQFDIRGINEPLALYRQHGSQMHFNLKALEQDTNTIYSKMFTGDGRPNQISTLRSQAYASLESTLAIAYLNRRQYLSGFSHTLRAIKYSLRTTFQKFAFIIRDKL